jgi:DNA-directed RNA polymerase specialized sigma24 family protein
MASRIETSTQAKKARELYVVGQLTLREIGARLEVNDATVRTWKSRARAAGDDWDQARAAYLATHDSRETLVERAVESVSLMISAAEQAVLKDASLTTLQKVEASTALASSLARLLNAQEKAQPQINRLSVAQDLLRDLVTFIQQRYPQGQDAAKNLLVEVLPAFAAHLNEIYA